MSRMEENGAGYKLMHLPLILHVSYQGFQSEKSQIFSILTISVQKMSRHCCWKCSDHEGIVFIVCIFTSPEANQSHVLPTASLSFALVAFYSSFTSRRSSPFHLSCNGVQHSWNATQLWDWVCRSVETWISPRQVCGMLVLSPLLHSPILLPQCWGLSTWVPASLATHSNKLPPLTLCNYRSNSVDVKVEVTWSILQLWSQRWFWSRVNNMHNSKNILLNEK